MSDQTLYEQSNVSQGTTEPFVQRQTVYVIDQNNGSYSGQIQVDTASLSNSGKYASYSEAYFEVPLVLRLTAKSANAQIAAIQALEPSFALGLKSGFHNIFHSYSVEYNNRNVVSLTPFSNIYTTFRLLTKLSQDDVVKYGSLIGLFPDTATSVRYQGVGASPFGHGSINNRNITQAAATVADWGSVVSGGYNEGFFKRQLTTTATNPAAAPTSAFFSTAAATAIGYNYFLKGSVANNVDSKWWFVLATIRLKDITDFFAKLPLVKGAFIKFQLNTNTAIHQIRVSVAGGVCTDVSCTQNNIVGGSTPLLLANGNQAGNGFNPIVAECITAGAGDYDFEIALSIARDTTYNVQHPTLQALRCYVPLYTFNPTTESQYLSLNKSKKVVYRDIYQYQVDVSTSGGGSGQFNQLLTNGIVGIKSVIIVPFIGSSSNATGVGGLAPIVPFGSPFASEPSTTSPYIALSNFNLAISGVNVYTLNELYDFSNFKDELSQANSVMGGIVDGLSSGLIGFNEFQTAYRYMYIDCSRRLPAEDFVAKSVQITGTVYAQQPNISLYCFIEQEKEVVVDLETGALIG